MPEVFICHKDNMKPDKRIPEAHTGFRRVVMESDYAKLRTALERISDGNVMQCTEHTHADTVVEYQRIATEALGIVQFDYFQGESDRHWYYVQRGVSAIEAKGPFMAKTCAIQHSKDGTFRVID